MQQESALKGSNSGGAASSEDLHGQASKFVLRTQSIGVRVKSDLLRLSRADIGSSIARLKRLGYGGMMPEAENLVKMKSAILHEVSSGKRSITKEDSQGLRPLFTQREIATLISYGELRREMLDKQEFLNAILKKVTETELSPSDVSEIKSTLGRTAAAKMTIVYNDRMAEEGKPEKMLKENEATSQLRKEISMLKAKQKEIRSILKLLNNLKDHKFQSPKKFFDAFYNIGPNAAYWISNMYWRDRSFLIQYAIGDNARIANPHKDNDGRFYLSLTNMSDLHQAEYVIQEHREQLKKSIRDIAKVIKSTSPSLDKEAHML